MPPGVVSVAFVACGSAGRISGSSELAFGLSIGARIARTREGVGVNGGTFDFLGLRLLLGVVGRAGFLKSSSSVGEMVV